MSQLSNGLVKMSPSWPLSTFYLFIYFSWMQRCDLHGKYQQYSVQLQFLIYTCDLGKAKCHLKLTVCVLQLSPAQHTYVCALENVMERMLNEDSPFNLNENSETVQISPDNIQLWVPTSITWLCSLLQRSVLSRKGRFSFVSNAFFCLVGPTALGLCACTVNTCSSL